MNSPFDRAWLLLKAVFQPSEGVRIGQGMNQMVFGQEGNPDVTKVGHGNTLSDMYLASQLARLMPDVFVEQTPIAQTAELPEQALRFMSGRGTPILSQQIRGRPFAESGDPKADAERGRQLATSLYHAVPLIESLGVADAKPPNWMAVNQPTALTASQITGRPIEGHALFHDPMFYGASHPTDPNAQMASRLARKDPRRLGVDYRLTDAQLEPFARQIDAQSFEDFADPVFDSEVPMTAQQELDLSDRVSNQQSELNRILGLLGLEA